VFKVLNLGPITRVSSQFIYENVGPATAKARRPNVLRRYRGISKEAGDERQIAVADDWQLQRLAYSSSTDAAAPCPGDIGGRSEQAYIQDPLQDFQPVHAV